MESPIKTQPHIIENIDEWPICKLYDKRNELVEEINTRTILKLKSKYDGKLDKLLGRTIYMEKIRMKESPWNADPQNEPIFWKKIQKSLPDPEADSTEIQSRSEYLLKKIVERYAEEIAGGFKKKTFLFARRFLRIFFRTLLNAASAKNIFLIFNKSKFKIDEKIKLFGPIEKIRNLANDGVLVIVPTHSSNLDSIMIGYALDAIAGLPAFSYGAGLNLYNNEIIGAFMNRLGAYRVDRRKKNPVYLEALKTMSNISLQWGTNTLFFPGGTRSRSGSIETKLKLGLLGTAIEAQREVIQKNMVDKKIYIVPLVLNYHCVLEARSLIEQHLRAIGKDNYIPPGRKDEFKSFKNIFVFLYRLLSQSSEIALSFGEPMDVIGNDVNEKGRSLDQYGKELNLSDYFMPIDEAEEVQSQRDNVYTSVLSEKIAQSYLRHNIVFSTNIVAYSAFKQIQKQNSGMDVFALLRLDPQDIEINPSDLEEYVGNVQKLLIQKSNEGGIKLDDTAIRSAKECILDAIKKLGVFHSSKPLRVLKNGNFGVGSLKILFFYHNRLDNYEFLNQLD